MDLRLYIDDDYGGDLKTHYSQTGFLILINRDPLDWYSKCQNMVESAVFGSEFLAQKKAMEHLHGLHYKLLMMGIPIVVPTYMYGKIGQLFKTHPKLNLL